MLEVYKGFLADSKNVGEFCGKVRKYWSSKYDSCPPRDKYLIIWYNNHT